MAVMHVYFYYIRVLFLKGLGTLMMMLKNHPSISRAVWNSSYFLNSFLWVLPVFFDCYVWSRYFYFWSKILMVLHTVLLLCGRFLMLHSVFQSEIRDLKQKQHLLSFPLLHVFHMCLWIIENPYTLKLICLFTSLYWVYTSPTNWSRVTYRV